ncbi:hypothetical protein Y1Q_0016868 [Alligator mississippiensis]|uniref:Uncharacterized protein n=1 Tax=Alligator mississippiensis TaxID=8496 RepID=A0A151P710_ALLMI|nr:hypothetical protein Y1Q_0016868 [Alligator mississippiensis]
MHYCPARSTFRSLDKRLQMDLRGKFSISLGGAYLVELHIEKHLAAHEYLMAAGNRNWLLCPVMLPPLCTHM